MRLKDYIMNKRSICKLSLKDYGLTPCNVWIEAKELTRGFSVLLWIEDYFSHPKRIASTRKNFSIDLFAKFLSNQSEITFDDTEDWKYWDVSGLGGYNAILLKTALFFGDRSSIYAWLKSQNHHSKEFLLSAIDWSDSDEVNFICLLSEIIFETGNSKGIIALLGSYQLEVSRAGLSKLLDVLEQHKEAVESQKDARQKIEKELSIAPYRERIDFISGHFDNEKKRIGAGISGSKPSKRTVLTRWIEEYVLHNSELPEGMHNVECPFLGGKLQLGIIDFSAFPSLSNTKD